MAHRDVITEKIHSLCRKPQPDSNAPEANYEREYRPGLHSPPFWWSEKPESKWPWQCWSLDDYSFKNSKWAGCYRPCTCRQKDEGIPVNCRYPGHCGFHRRLSKKCPKCSKEKKQKTKNLCCYCKLGMAESNQKAGEGALPDPRCIGQFHDSLLENILGRGTTLEIGKNKCSAGKDSDSIRGYVPGDVYGSQGWSGCVGGDPMREELNNSFFPLENSSTDLKLSKLSGNREAMPRRPSYDNIYQDHRYQYGIQPEQLLYQGIQG